MIKRESDRCTQKKANCDVPSDRLNQIIDR
jgi:hypothetical protein